MKTSRRTFLGGAAAAIAAPTIIPSSVLGKNAPSNRITMGFVGMGNRGIGVMEAFLRHDDVEGIAVCDVAKHHVRVRNGKSSRDYGLDAGKAAMEKAQDGKTCDAYHDFRELVARDDIDAVQVATPDHWHAIITMAALKTGKDIYCEKPITHKFAEGLAIHREVAKQKAVFQVGSQQRSDKKFQQAVEIARNGLLGKVTRVEVGLPKGHNKPDGDPTITDPPAGLDWNFWCGPSEVLPYCDARSHWSWRWHCNYGGGQLMDWIGHHNDIAHWGLGEETGGPIRVEAKNWVFPEIDLYDSPVEYEVHTEYRNGVELMISSRIPMGAKWIGENGWVHVTRGKLTASDPAWAEDGFEAGDWKTYKTVGHQRNFVDCAKTREETIAPAENGHRSITPGYLAYVSHELGRAIKWDPAAEKVVGDPSAQERLMALPYRDDWTLG